jgi:cell volume regulation protein A
VFLALASHVQLESDIFSMILIVALLSITVQGTLFTPVARKLDMVDDSTDYLLSFNDFQEQSAHSFFRINVSENNNWANHAIRDIPLGSNILIVLIKRGEQTITPRGDTVILPNDILVLSGEQYTGDSHTTITQMQIEKGHSWAGLQIKDLSLPASTLIVSVVRQDGTAIIPKGWVTIKPDDTLTLFNLD